MWTDATGENPFPDPTGRVSWLEGIYIGARIQMDFLAGNSASRRAEYAIPGASNGVGRGTLWIPGFADMIDFANGEVYEIKSQREYFGATNAAKPQVAGYVDGLNQAARRPATDRYHRPAPANGTWTLGATYLATEVRSFGLWPFGIDPTYNPARDGFYEIKATLSNHLGIIIYWADKISEKRARWLVPRYDPDAVLDHVHTTYPRWRRPPWGNGYRVLQPYPGMHMGDAGYWCRVTGELLEYSYEELGQFGYQLDQQQADGLPLIPASGNPIPVVP